MALIKGAPHPPREGFKRNIACDGAWIADEGGQHLAVTLVGVDQVCGIPRLVKGISFTRSPSPSKH